MCKWNVNKATLFQIDNHEDGESIQIRIPFYFIFITCPSYDYEISNTPKQATLDFKNWNHINKLLEKLIKFYIGDLKVTEIKINQVTCNKENDTRKQVKNIMNKILGSHPKKPGVSQMQNGIKGSMWL